MQPVILRLNGQFIGAVLHTLLQFFTQPRHRFKGDTAASDLAGVRLGIGGALFFILFAHGGKLCGLRGKLCIQALDLLQVIALATAVRLLPTCRGRRDRVIVKHAGGCGIIAAIGKIDPVKKSKQLVQAAQRIPGVDLLVAVYRHIAQTNDGLQALLYGFIHLIHKRRIMNAGLKCIRQGHL